MENEKLILGKVTMFEMLLGFVPQYEKELEHLFDSNNLDKNFIKPSPRKIGWTTYTLLCMGLGFLFLDDFDTIIFTTNDLGDFDKESRVMDYNCCNYEDTYETCIRFKKLLINYFGEETFNRYFEVTSNSITKIKTKGEI